MTERYEEAYKRSLAEPDAFWLEAARQIDWNHAPVTGWDSERGWFADGMLNTCWNAVDRHVEAGHGERLALIYTSPVGGRRQEFSFALLRDQVSRTAGMLAALGVRVGDRVVLYMPMIPETVFAMLACARIGAIHVVVFGGFAAAELAKRIDDTEPKIILTASCGLEGHKVLPYKPLIDLALELASHKPRNTVILQREQCAAALDASRDLEWFEQLERASPVRCVPVRATDPLYILHTSGTTGTPKGVVRQNGGHAVALAWSMKNIYGMKPGEVFWAASDVGWVVGHSYIVYGPLIAGCTTVLFEGKPIGTPDAGIFWRTITECGVNVFFTAPTAIRAVRSEDPEGRFLSEIGTGKLRALFLAGERADPATIAWTEEKMSLPVIDHWWQTELGWPALSTCLGLGDARREAGSAGRPVPGFDFSILGDDAERLAAGIVGHVAIRTPLPPGCFADLWRNRERFEKPFERFAGYYDTGDSGQIDTSGFVSILSRTDDLINVAGHRLSTGQMEQILMSHSDIAECAVIGVDDPVKGMVPVAFVVARKCQVDVKAVELMRELVELVRRELGPVSAMKTVHLVDALPKTRSGKTLRTILRELAAGVSIKAPETIEDPDVLVSIQSVLSAANAVNR